MKKTVIVDTFSIGGFHEMFNTSFLYVILNSSTSPLLYIADKSAINAIVKLLKEDQEFQGLSNRITFKPKKPPKRKFILRYIF